MEARNGTLEPGQLSQAGSSQPIRTIQPAAHAARQPDVRDRRQTDIRQTVRQHRRLMPPGREHNHWCSMLQQHICSLLVTLGIQMSSTGFDACC